MATLVMFVLHGSSARAGPAESPEATLKQQLIGYLEGEAKPSSAGALSALRSYPLTATTAYLLLESDPGLLKEHYSAISRSVMQLFAEANIVSGGLVKGMPNASQPTYAPLSPGLNALADLELYSLHLIASRTGAYEDALEFLSWSNTLADLVSQRFYDPRRQCFYPVADDGRFVTTYAPGQLLPLVLDRTLGPDARDRIAAEYFSRSAASSGSNPKGRSAPEPWNDPLMRYPMLDFFGETLRPDADLSLALRSSAALSPANALPGQALWVDYWRDNAALRKRLFPPWRTLSSLVNVTLLFEREGIVPPKELAGLRNGVDSLVAALSGGTMSLEAYQDATEAANRLLGWISRFSELFDSTKERWRILDEAKWMRLSPRARRLISEALAASRSDIARAKADLSARLERDQGLQFRLELPERPVPPGKPIDFTASLRVLRDSLEASQLYVQIGEKRWKMTESARVVELSPGGAPLRYQGTVLLPPETEPGIVTLHSIIDFLVAGRRVEIHRVESVALAQEYDVTLDLPEGRRILDKPVPVQITLTYRPDHDVQGTVEGTFLREFATKPPLPANFLVNKDTERTELTLSVSPKGPISPGRYPFTLTVALNGAPIALLEESLVRPFRWLWIGPLAKAEPAMRNAVSFQADLLKSYTTADGRALRWKEAPAGVIDSEGSLWPHRLCGNAPGSSILLYTAVDCPSRSKFTWKLVTKNTSSLWINSEPLVPSAGERPDETKGTVELRKGPNSFLIALSWEDAPDRVLFELSDDSGLPPTGMSNEIESIIDGYDRLTAPESSKKTEKPAADQIRNVPITYTNASAVEVSVIGSFNNWEPGSTPMKREAKGAWTASLQLRPGRYAYKLLVNRKQKIVDPANPVTEPDGFGGRNSVLEIK